MRKISETPRDCYESFFATSSPIVTIRQVLGIPNPDEFGIVGDDGAYKIWFEGTPIQNYRGEIVSGSWPQFNPVEKARQESLPHLGKVWVIWSHDLELLGEWKQALKKGDPNYREAVTEDIVIMWRWFEIDNPFLFIHDLHLPRSIPLLDCARNDEFLRWAYTLKFEDMTPHEEKHAMKHWMPSGKCNQHLDGKFRVRKNRRGLWKWSCGFCGERGTEKFKAPSECPLCKK